MYNNTTYNYMMISLWSLMLVINCIAINQYYNQEKKEEILNVEELKKSCPNIEEKLEEFMGGDISPTEEGQAWIDSICEVSK